MKLDLEKILATLREFNKERDWDQFHSPKNLATAISVEAGELLSHFTWITTEESESYQDIEGIKEEIADVLICTLMLADRMHIPLEQAIFDKIKRNGDKYPAESSKGVAQPVSASSTVSTGN